MKLFYSTNSPYARKCRVVIIEKGLQDKVEMVLANPSDNPPELIAANPLCTVPALVLDNGKSLCESPVICEYLDSLSPQNPLFPTDKTERFEALALAALGDGIMDAAVACVMEGRRPEEKRYKYWTDRKENAAKRTIDAISKFNLVNDNWNIGTINAAVALAYADLRIPHINWRDGNKELAKWLDFINKKPSMVETAPIP
jgi:glutathione S-transferase